MHGSDVSSVVDWLAEGARSAPDEPALLGELCDRLVGCGVPLWRVGVFLLALHPQIRGRRFLWRPGAEVETAAGPAEYFQTEESRRSPFRRVVDTGVALRRRLADQNCPADFEILAELKAQGATDYVATPLVFSDGVVHCVTAATQRPGGFTDGDIAKLEAILPSTARVFEIQTLRRTASALLDTYVGNHAGPRILAGQIRRGDTITIHAAIWLSDMCGFTRLTDRLDPQTLLALLNRYFDCQVPAIQEHGGEVLKYMGDGLLAIFPLAPGGANAREVCDAALDAACAARAAVLADFPDAEATARDSAGLRMALHLGQVLYGNIGSGSRLDFTCIGPAVNLAARIERLAGELGWTILASEEFARHAPSRLAPVGEFALPGIAGAQAVFGLTEERDRRHRIGAQLQRA